jgi:hypothetical protein
MIINPSSAVCLNLVVRSPEGRLYASEDSTKGLLGISLCCRVNGTLMEGNVNTMADVDATSESFQKIETKKFRRTS